MPLKILINGGGIAGPALANFLLRTNQRYDITVVERSPIWRTGGTQIDLKAQGTPLMRKLGLIDAVREKSIHETHITLVDTNGRTWASFSVNKPGEGLKAITSEFELMRADLVSVLYNGSVQRAKTLSGHGQASLQYLLGKHAVELTQTGDKVLATFSDGSSDNYDLVVGADGQSSLTRRLAFGAEAGPRSPQKEVGFTVAYFNIPKAKWEIGNTEYKHFVQIGPKVISFRCGHKDFTQVMLSVPTTEAMREAARLPIEDQKDLWAGMFKGLGWESERVLAAMRTADDFYMTTIAQVKMDTWHKGRVVLLGDAGYCPSVATGLGTTLSLVGAYVLAGELARNGDDVATALACYEKELRPFVEEAQILIRMPISISFMGSRLGLVICYFVAAFLSMIKIDKLTSAFSGPVKETWGLPDYPELDLEA
ncbi:FAD/NAD(P)-binding domain-containing protein [Thozetella sp. PMI_491]|nr:FAD/NAD(P)-binding domain-containing protein [Thozetella sp. PMI_491]